jgi:peptidoglycan hydrolase CwlO-like protein
MGLGSTAKKLQTLADTAEKLYARMNDLREQLVETQASVKRSTERLDSLESEVAEQRAILEALARDAGLDVESIAAEAHISEAEGADADADDDGTVTADPTGNGDGTDDTDGEPIPVDEEGPASTTE